MRSTPEFVTSVSGPDFLDRRSGSCSRRLRRATRTVLPDIALEPAARLSSCERSRRECSPALEEPLAAAETHVVRLTIERSDADGHI